MVNYVKLMLQLEDSYCIIQSVPSPNAEHLKQWLAQGSERLDEITDPEIVIEGAINTYREKGYSEKWIAQRRRY